MKNKKIKCTFCAKEINDSPYRNGEKLYHTACHFLIGDIKNMSKKALHKLHSLSGEALMLLCDREQDEINCC